MPNTLILIRGLPGSGKSTLAYALKTEANRSQISECETVWREADMYFKDRHGKYLFDPSRLKEAHAWCQKEVEFFLSDPLTDVIVSNTFTQRWELQPYVNIAKRCNSNIQLIECQGNFGNIHNVPEASIQAMRNRWEHITLESLI